MIKRKPYISLEYSPVAIATGLLLEKVVWGKPTELGAIRRSRIEERRTKMLKVDAVRI